jgi:hypothetical protein
VIIHGTLPGFGHSDGMTSYLKANGIRIFDYTKFAEPLRDQIPSNAEALAEQSGIEIQFLRKSNIRNWEMTSIPEFREPEFAITWVPTSYQPSAFRYQPTREDCWSLMLVR